MNWRKVHTSMKNQVFPLKHLQPPQRAEFLTKSTLFRPRDSFNAVT